MKTVYFAGGCFWGIEAYFKKIKGIIDTDVGYAQGETKNPSYEEVCRKSTGHAETVEIKYDENQVTLNELMIKLFKVIDPISLNKQGNDVGSQYRTGIYYVDECDKVVISEFLNKMQNNYKEKIVVENEYLKCFYRAEEYHQDYLDKNPNGYCHIDLNS